MIGYVLFQLLMGFGVVIFYIFYPNSCDLKMKMEVEKQQIINKQNDIDISDGMVRADIIYHIILTNLIAPFINLGIALLTQLSFSGYFFIELSRVFQPRIATIITKEEERAWIEIRMTVEDV